MNRINLKNKNGYTLVELLFYLSIFLVLSITVINSLVTMTKAFKETTIQGEFLQGAATMERVSRETRQAFSVNSISATDLVLNTQNSSGTNETMEFTLSGTNIQLKEAGVLTGNLNPPNISVTGLSFSQIASANSTAVKMSLSVKANNDTQSRTVTFYDTVVLRGSY